MAKPVTRVLVLQHVPFEGPGRIGTLAEARGLKLDVLRLDQGATVPERLPEDSMLVVMGGPMGVGDRGDPRYPFLERELALLQTVLKEERPVLGICLGAQLIAAAAGASVRPNLVGEPPKALQEVGWGAITFVPRAVEEPVLNGLDQSEVVLHWHGDTFDLPAGAVHLASTLQCPNQFMRLGRRAFALQFHIEVDDATVRTWVQEDTDFVRAAGGDGLGARILADTTRFMPRHRTVGDRLIGNLLNAMLGG